MNPEQIAAHLKRLSSTLTPWQIATLLAAFAGVVGLVTWTAFWVNQPSYALLYTGLDAESAAAVVARLKTAQVPHELGDGGTSVRVPVERLDELRLDLAAQGLPATGRIGFEVFDRTAFGTTEFLEQVNFRRGLEGELGRTIGTLTEVASARVHIAPAKDSLFTGDAEPAKASVVLKLRNARPLSASTVAAIAGLVAGSVETLRPEAVVIVDTAGRPLSKLGPDDDEATGLPLERQQQVERDMATKVVALLEPVVGPGHVRVNVSARLSGTSEEQTEERWDPTTVVRSRQSTSDLSGGAASQGVAGARANAAPGLNQAAKPPSAPVATTPSGRSTETVNYEVNKLTRHTVVPRGQLTRLSVAVIVDHAQVTTAGEGGQARTESKPRDPADLKRIEALVAAAVGLDTERGDRITVENIAFDEPPAEDAPENDWWRTLTPDVQTTAPQLLRLAGAVTLALLGFLLVLRPMVRAAFATTLPAALGGEMAMPSAIGEGVRTVADLEGEIEAEIDASLTPKGTEGRRLPVLTRRIAKKAENEPEHLARLVRSLLVEEEK